MKAENSRRGAVRNHWSAALLALVTMLAADPALAVDRIWNGGGVDDFWGTADNWDGVAPIGGDRRVFAGGNKLTTNSNNLPTGTAFAGIRFDATAGAFTLSGNLLRSGAGTSVDFSANPASAITQTIQHDFLITSSGSLTFTTQPNGTITGNGAINDATGDQVVNMNGTGTLNLNGTRNFSGQARLNGGTIQAKVIANAGVSSSLGLGDDGAGSNPIIRIGNAAATVALVYTGVSAASTNRQVQVGIGTAVTDIGGATIANNVADPAHTLTFSNAAFSAANTTAIAPRTLTLSGTNTGQNTITGAIVDNAADGSEELYDQYEWTNLAAKPEHAAQKAELAKHLATSNVPTLKGKGGDSEADEAKAARKAKRQAGKK